MDKEIYLKTKKNIIEGYKELEGYYQELEVKCLKYSDKNEVVIKEKERIDINDLF